MLLCQLCLSFYYTILSSVHLFNSWEFCCRVMLILVSKLKLRMQNFMEFDYFECVLVRLVWGWRTSWRKRMLMKQCVWWKCPKTRSILPLNMDGTSLSAADYLPDSMWQSCSLMWNCLIHGLYSNNDLLMAFCSGRPDKHEHTHFLLLCYKNYFFPVTFFYSPYQ